MHTEIFQHRGTRASRSARLCLFLLAFLLGSMLPNFIPTQRVQAQGTFDCSSVVDIPVTECEALVNIYNNTGGAAWTRRNNWLASTTICGSWEGVYCFAGHVDQLSLGTNNLVGTLPPQVGDLAQLRYLYLNNNQLTSLPPEIGNLAQLRYLYLYNNQLTNLPPEIGDLVQLVYLYLYNNQLTSLPPEIGALAQLRYLYLNNNQLTSLPPEIGNLVGLQRLFLYSNQLTSLPPEAGYLTQLQYLHLHNNELTSWPTALNSLTNLSVLYLSNNQLATLPPALGNLTQLRNLYLQGNQLASWPSALNSLTNLYFLDLSNNQLPSVPPEIGTFAQLQTLLLYGNQLTSLPPEFANLTQLRTLYLDNNELTSWPTALNSLTNLNLLNLSNNALTTLPPEIGNFTRLRTLFLHGAQLTSVPPEIGNLSQLQTLYLHYNSLTSLPPEIGNLTQLRYLYLYNNQLMSLPPEIGNLIWLLTLYIHDNQQLSGALPGALVNLVNLTRFNFYSTQLCVPADPTIQDWLDAVEQRGRVSGTGILCGPPSADTTGPYTVIEGGQVLLEGLGNDSYGSALSFAWDLDGDSTFETVGQNVFFSAVGMSGPAQQTVALQVCNTQQLCTTADTEVTITNEAPTVNAGPDQFGIFRSALVTLLGTWTDPAGAADAPYGWTWDLTGDDAVDSSGTADYDAVIEETTDFTNEGQYKLTFSVEDKDGGMGHDTVMVEVINRAPQLTVAHPQITVDEGSSAANQGTITDEDGDGSSLVASSGEISQDGSNWAWSAMLDDGPLSQLVIIEADDGHGGYDDIAFDLVVNNVPPMLSQIEADQDVIALGASINMHVDFSDPGRLDTHTAVWDWGDGTTSDGTISSQNEIHSVSGSHSYDTVGIYRVSLTVTDSDNGATTATYQYAVVYDPSAGFVTGGGWIMSPAGACRLDALCPQATGKANFGFVAKYKKGATVPTGQTVFQFKAGNLNFNSSSYDWLVVAGARAQYKGVGTINGQGTYGFMLTAIDSEINGGGDSDKFRIKIWDMNNEGVIVYDNQMDDTDDAELTTVLGGGSIVIHSSKETGGGKKGVQSAATLDQQPIYLPLITP